MKGNHLITVSVVVDAPIEKVVTGKRF